MAYYVYAEAYVQPFTFTTIYKIIWQINTPGATVLPIGFQVMSSR